MRKLILTAFLLSAASAVVFGQAVNRGGAITQQFVQGGGIEQELEALMQREFVAETTSDVATIRQIWADEYIATGPKGQLSNKAQMIQYYSITPASKEKSGSLKFDEIKANVYGDVAVMTGRVTKVGQNNLPAGPSLRFTRVHVRRGGRWQVVASHLSLLESPRQPQKTAPKK